jgi:ABC-2 type transport system permease protein
MSAAAARARGGPFVVARQISQIAGRSVTRTFRQPGVMIANVSFPLLLLAVNSGGLRSATRLPGFPTDSFLDFFLPFSFLQGAVFAALVAGTDLGRDIDTGFLNRLALTPMRGGALLFGQLGGAVALGAIQAAVYLAVGLAAGARWVTGIPGIVVLVVLALAVALAFGALGLFLALRAGSGEGVQSAFPLLFFLLFISSMLLPRNLIEADWFRIAATLNPVSYMIEGMRSLIIEGWNAPALLLGFGFAFAFFAAGLGAAALALRTRMART